MKYQPRIHRIAPAHKRHGLIVTWTNGTEATVDLSDLVDRLAAFEPIRNAAAFRKVEVGEDGWSVKWDEDTDVSVETLWRLAAEQSGEAMPAAEFREWRRRNRLSLSQAAEALGLSRRTVAYYESGVQMIPKTVLLACRSIDADGVDAGRRQPVSAL